MIFDKWKRYCQRKYVGLLKFIDGEAVISFWQSIKNTYEAYKSFKFAWRNIESLEGV